MGCLACCGLDSKSGQEQILEENRSLGPYYHHFLTTCWLSSVHTWLFVVKKSKQTKDKDIWKESQKETRGSVDVQCFTPISSACCLRTCNAASGCGTVTAGTPGWHIHKHAVQQRHGHIECTPEWHQRCSHKFLFARTLLLPFIFPSLNLLFPCLPFQVLPPLHEQRITVDVQHCWEQTDRQTDTQTDR